MFESQISRRSFLKGSLATTALAGAGLGTVSFTAWQNEAQAEENTTYQETPSLCNGCSSKCGLIATVKDGRLWTLRGNEKHPYSKGAICARGHGMAQLAYAKERITQPLKKNENGDFEPISWDDAFSEIGAKVKAILEAEGSEAIAVVHDPRPSGKYYAERFSYALGSPNVYTHGAACNLSKESGFEKTIGAGNYSIDTGQAKMLMFIGRSYGDAIRPSSIAGLTAAAESGTRIVIVDPRLNNTGNLATDWVPIAPGTDLAFILAMCQVLIAQDAYDKDFIAEHTLGFDEFAEQVKQYTPAWAEDICGIPAEQIEELALAMAKAAPAAGIEASWRAAFGCAYKNSFECARAIAAFNALLGSWGQKGGVYLTSSPKAGSVDKERFPSVPKPEATRVGDDEFPLAISSMGTNLAVVTSALEGSMKACFFYNSNAAKGYAQPKVWREALAQLELSVVIDVQMSETALCADYVLPECTYLERVEVPDWVGGKKHYIALRAQVLDVIHPETKPCDEIFSGLAKACGKGELFGFSAEDLARAQCESVGVSYEELQREGVIELKDPGFEYGKPGFKTKSGKLEFVSEAVGKAGRNPIIDWIPRKVMPKEGEFHFIGGKQGIHSHTMTMNIPALNAISREYGLEKVWMNASDAQALEIADGDTVEIASSEFTGQIGVRVTERLRPGVVYIPTHYGGSSPELSHAYDYGLCMADFVPFDMEPGVGSVMNQEVVVSVRKVEA